MKHNNSEAKQVCDVYTDNVKKSLCRNINRKRSTQTKFIINSDIDMS